MKFDDELHEDDDVPDDDDGVQEDRELFLQLYADLHEALAAEYERLAQIARDKALVAYRRDDRLSAMRRGREALAALVQARICRERAAECLRELHALIQMLAQEFAESAQADSAREAKAEAEMEAGDHHAQPPSL